MTMLRAQAGVRCRFDETVDVAIKLGTDPRRSDQQVLRLLLADTLCHSEIV